jgi:hypothetical protein
VRKCTRSRWSQCPDHRQTVSTMIITSSQSLFAHRGRPSKVVAGQADGIQPRTIEVFQVSYTTLESLEYLSSYSGMLRCRRAMALLTDF